MGDSKRPAVTEGLVFVSNLIFLSGCPCILWFLLRALLGGLGVPPSWFMIWMVLLLLCVAYAYYCFGPLRRACVGPEPDEDTVEYGRKAVVVGWERRRLAYNVILPAVVLLVLREHFVTLVYRFRNIAIMFAIVANVCYTVGPLSELFFQSSLKRRVGWARDVVFWIGLTFSVWWAWMWALRGLGKL